jgi:hypothetical protein
MHQRMSALVAGRWRGFASRVAMVVAAWAAVTGAWAGPVEVSRGLAWLQAQVSADGRLAVESKTSAAVQAGCETATTLVKLAGPDPSVMALVASLPSQDRATETLGCWSDLRAQLGLANPGTETVGRRVVQQGWSAYEGYGAPSMTDTGRVLATRLQALPSTDRSTLLAWLGTRQAADGSFATAGRPDLLATAAILRGLHAEASRDAAAAAMAARAAAWLLAARDAQGRWAAGDIATTSVVFEAVHPYLDAAPGLAAAVEAWLLGLQRPDGSWSGDPYDTAVALRALALAAVPPLDPTRGAVQVRFVDARNASAVAGVRVESAVPAAVAVSDAQGRAALTALAPGRYEWVVSAAGYPSLSLTATVAAGQVVDLGTIQLVAGTATAVVSGTVRVQGTQAALAGASVVVEGQGLSALTGSDGAYLIAGVTPGTIHVTAGKPGYTSASGSITAQAGQVLNFSPVLAAATGGPPCGFAGNIRDAATGQPLAGAGVSVSGLVVAMTDAAGAFATTTLASGTHAITVAKPGYDTVSAVLQLTCAATGASVVDFSPRLYAAGQTPADANVAGLTGVVMDAATNQPIAHAQLQATLPDGSTKSVQALADGTFRIVPLEGTRTQVAVSAAGYQPLVAGFLLQPLQVLDIAQLRLRRTQVEQLLPDLKVISVTRHEARTDPQTLQLAGAVQVRIGNAGTQSSPAGATLTAFHDRDGDGRFQPGVDLLLGQSAVAHSLAPGESATVDIAVSGAVPFRDAPVHVGVDAHAVLPDADRANNSASTAAQAVAPSPPIAISPKLKWSWTGSAVSPAYADVAMAPVVGRVIDTNGDGVIDALDTPSVVFTTFEAGHYNEPGVIRVVNGATGQELLSISEPTHGVAGLSGLVLADLDADGRPEIIGLTPDGRVIAFRNDGTHWWTSQQLTTLYAMGSWGAPTVADLDGDGSPEIIMGRSVLNKDGTLKWKGTGRNFGNGMKDFNNTPTFEWTGTPVAADLFATGRQDVILGSAVYTHDGQLRWEDPSDGYAGVADFEGQGEPSIVVVAQGYVRLYSRTGQLKWRVALPTSRGGPPAIGDLDGDGRPEIGIAGNDAYTVLRGDGSLVWWKPIDEGSSGITASALFDFNGDGLREVAHADEKYVQIFRGTDGQVQASVQNFSETAIEFPVVADIDADGRADFVVAANRTAKGIRAYQDTGNAWPATRSVWNQHAYAITNINDDLTVPRNPQPPWRSHNTFRANPATLHVAAAPDLTVGFLRASDGGTAGSTLTVRAGNAGSAAIAAGTRFAVYRADPALATPSPSTLLGTATLPHALQPGQWRDVDLPVAGSLAAIGSEGQVWVAGDDDGTGRKALADPDRANNVVAGKLAALASNVVATASTDKATYAEGAQAILAASLRNEGSFPVDVQVRFSVLDAYGGRIESLPLGAPVGIPAGGAATVTGLWAAGGVLAGTYLLRVELLSPAGLVYGSATAPLVVGSHPLAASARVASDRLSYTASQVVAVSSRVFNASGNQPLQGAKAVTEVRGAGVVFARTESIDELASSGSRQFGYLLPAADLAPGTYTVSLRLLDAGGSALAEASGSFAVLGTAQSGAGLSGTLAAQPAAVRIGESVQFTLLARNDSRDALAQVPVVVRLIDPAGGNVAATLSATIADWQPGQARTVTLPWVASGSPGQLLVASAMAQTGGTEVALGQANVQLAGVALLQASPGEASFATVYVGEAATRTLTFSSAGSLPVGSLTFTIGGSDAGAFALQPGGCTQSGILAAGSSCTLQVTYRPQAIGPHTGELRANHASGTLGVALSGQAKPVVFTGSLSAGAAEVEAGQEVALSYVVSNPAGVTATWAGNLSVRRADAQVLATWPLAAGVPALGSYAGSQAYTTGPQAQALTAVLTQQSGSSTWVLGTATFAVTDSQVPVAFTATQAASARILVLLSCPVGNKGQDDAACVAQRSAAIQSYFGAMGVPVTVVSTAPAFAAQMRCGAFNTYWLSGGAAKLDAGTIGELRLAVRRGEALWMDGVHDSRNQLLHDVAGVKQVGKLTEGNQPAALDAAGLFGAGTLATRGQPTRFELAGGAAQALFTQVAGNQPPAPAVVSHAWGQGRSLLFAFDLAGMVTLEPGAAPLRAFMDAAIAHAASGRAALTAGDMTTVRVSVTNEGSRTAVLTATATLPPGLVPVQAAGSPQVVPLADGSMKTTWSLDVAPGATQVIDWQVRAAFAGSYAIPLELHSVATPPRLRAGATVNLHVLDAAALLDGPLPAVQALAPTAASDRSARNKAADAVTQAVALHGSGQHEAALAKWLDATAALETIVSADTTEARLAVALAAEATTDALCIQRCGSAGCQ